MDIVIEKISNSEDVAAMLEVWQQVFERELGIVLPQDCASGNTFHWLARLEGSREPVGTLSVVDTSDQHQLHDSLGLGFDPRARIARFTHLAVLKPYRGRNIPLAMMLEAHRSMIVPGQFDNTWLLFDVEKAANSFLARQLGFTVLPQTFVSEYGCRCPLVRNERSPKAKQTIRDAELYLRQLVYA
jgi:ribosomal protein S18 acetylase RimI-like enzyme